MENIFQYENQKWTQIPYDFGSKDKNFIIESLDFSLHPNIVLGDEINFIAIFQHPENSTYLFRIEIEDFSEIFLVKGLDSFFEMHSKCSTLIQDHFNTLLSIDALKND